MTMEKREARIVGGEINFRFLISAEHKNIFHHPGGRLAGDAGEFEGVPVKMNRVYIITGIAQAQAVAVPLMEMK